MQPFAYSDDYIASETPGSAMYDVHRNTSMYVNVLTWADYIYTVAEADYNWDGLYKSNYVTNYVLANIDRVEDGVDYDRNEVKGQALVHRAMNYFLLVNLYGKQYNAATADTDLGVPLILAPDINNSYPRETVGKIYEQLVGDLTEAIGLLTVDVPEYNNVPGRATAYALRARVYLWMQNYDEAYNDATEALKLRSEITDYNTLSQYMPGIPAYGISGYSTIPQTNPEIMYSRYRTERSYMQFSQKMLNIIDTENDLRYTLFYGAYPDAGLLDPVSWTRIHHSGIDVSEVWLTKAEAALRKSSPNVTEAIEALDYVRDRRYLNQNYTAAPTDPDALLTEILNELAEGKINILIGTHALFQEDVSYKELGFVVVDEQHRFGVHQRLKLSEKGDKADVLIMTATPIPRTLVLTSYGDMEYSKIDQVPEGRKPVDTRVLPLGKLAETAAALKRKIESGTRAYWVCPLVEESEKSDLAAAEARFEDLRKIFGDDVGLVHGKMKEKDKDAVMERFKRGEIKLLVATTVIEVGVNVPEATIMVIEHAERFGLAQLHQLRGRVKRGFEVATCLLLYGQPLSETARERLNIMKQTEDGFLIAEKDLELRGGGEILGTRQSGFCQFRLADMEYHKNLLFIANQDAKLVLNKDPNLQSPRGQALRVLLYLFEQDDGVKTYKA